MTNANTTSTHPDANTIRAALKAAGYNARRVTVKSGGSSTHSSYKVTIRDASVSLSAITKIAMPYENVRRDGYGEILSGGNTYVDVEYHDSVVGPIAESFRQRIQASAAGELVQLDGGFAACKVSRENATYHDEVELHGPCFEGPRRHIAVSVGNAANRLAVAYLDTIAAANAEAKAAA